MICELTTNRTVWYNNRTSQKGGCSIKKIVAWILLLTVLLGVFGCASIDAEIEAEPPTLENPNFIGGKSNALSGDEDAERPQALLNFAATDQDGGALFQIVHKIGAAEWLIEECHRLSDAIFDETGVRVPVVHSMEKEKTIASIIHQWIEKAESER